MVFSYWKIEQLCWWYFYCKFKPLYLKLSFKDLLLLPLPALEVDWASIILYHPCCWFSRCLSVSRTTSPNICSIDTNDGKLNKYPCKIYLLNCFFYTVSCSTTFTSTFFSTNTCSSTHAQTSKIFVAKYYPISSFEEPISKLHFPV